MRRGLVLFLLLAGLCAATWPVVRAEEPPNSKSASGSKEEQEKASEEFLKLPAHEADRVVAVQAQTQPQTAPAQDRVGDVVIFRVNGLEVPGVTKPGVELKVSVPKEDVVDQGWGLIEKPGTLEGELRFEIGLYKKGRAEIPSLQISTADGKAVARTQPFVIEVQSAIAADDQKPQEPADPRPPVSLVFPWMVIALAVLFLLLGGAALTYLIVRYIQGRKPKPLPQVVEAPPRPEDEVALEALAALEQKRLLSQGKFKPHYFGVSEILKTYIGGRYRFDAQESTSREITEVLAREKGVSDTVLREIEEVFARLDFVKFTDHVPEEAEGVNLLERSRKLVQETRRMRMEITPNAS